METILCPHCGASAPALNGLGLILALLDTHINGLVHLFEKKLDIANCEAGCLLNVRPTVAVLNSDTNTLYLVFGSRVENLHKEVLAEIEPIFKESEVTIQVLDSMDNLRDSVKKHLIDRIKLIETLFEAISSDNILKYLQANWRKFTPSVFVALRVALTGLVPGVMIGIKSSNAQELSKANSLQPFAEAQAKVLLALCMTWISGDDHSSSLETDLQHFVDESPVIEGASGILFSMFDHLQASELMFHSRFCIEAVRASFCDALGLTNTWSMRWTQLFFMLEVALRTDGDALPTKIKALSISEERAHATVSYQDLYVVATEWLDEELKKQQEPSKQVKLFELLEEIIIKSGHDRLCDIIMENVHLRIISIEQNLSETLVEALKTPLDDSDLEEFVSVVKKLARPLVEQKRVDDLEKVADAMIQALGGTNEARANVNAWLGARLKDLRMPQRFLTRVGRYPQSWEYDLPISRRVNLWVERSNALRLIGQTEEALQLLDEVTLLVNKEDDAETWHTLQKNRAILLRESGSPDAAIKILEQLIKQIPREEQFDVLESLAVTYIVIGRYEDAIRSIDEALKVTVGIDPTRIASLQASRTQIPTDKFHAPEVVSVTETAQAELRAHPVTTLAEVGAWINFLANSNELPAGASDRLDQLFMALPDLIEDAKAVGDASIHLTALKCTALLMDYADPDQTEMVWRELVSVAVETYEQFPDPTALVKLANHAFGKGDLSAARRWLTLIPQAVAGYLGGIQDIKPVANSTLMIGTALDELTTTVLFNPNAKGDWEDVRFISELRRDMIGRSQLLRHEVLDQEEPSLPPGGITNERLSVLAPSQGRLAVLECIDSGEYTAFFITCIDSDYAVSSHWLTLPDSDLDFQYLASKINTKLNTWTLLRAGSPFDLPEWRIFETWIIEQLEAHLSENDHIVFIEHKDFLGIPWHVAVAPKWTSSYISSWTSLLALYELPLERQTRSVGIALVPRFGDPAEVIVAMDRSSQNAKSCADVHELASTLIKGGECDAQAFLHMMSQSDIALLLCHGYVDPADGEVALMLAYDGALPLGHALASASVVGQQHRMSWRNCQDLKSAPRIIFSAACSSGARQIAGGGDHLGFFSALRNIGSKTLLAPRWDIIGPKVLPIIDEALAHYLIDSNSLAQTVRSVCQAAAKANCPRWLAWSLAIEGDWR